MRSALTYRMTWQAPNQIGANLKKAPSSRMVRSGCDRSTALKFDIRAIPRRDLAQLIAVGVSLLGIVVMLVGGALVPILARLPPAAVTVDGVRGVDGDVLWRIMDLSSAVGSTGFTMMAGGAITWSIISPATSWMSIWSRVSSFFLWSSMLVLLFAFSRMSMAAIGGTVLGKLTYATLAVSFVSISLQLVTESVLRFRSRQTSSTS